jgi:NADPH:quinone reductase-like Zn-dependent oxidoreductase
MRYFCRTALLVCAVAVGAYSVDGNKRQPKAPGEKDFPTIPNVDLAGEVIEVKPGQAQLFLDDRVIGPKAFRNMSVIPTPTTAIRLIWLTGETKWPVHAPISDLVGVRFGYGSQSGAGCLVFMGLKGEGT